MLPPSCALVLRASTRWLEGCASSQVPHRDHATLISRRCIFHSGHRTTRGESFHLLSFPALISAPRMTGLWRVAGPRLEARRLCHWRINHSFQCIDSRIVDPRHHEVRRCLAHCSRSHCLPVPAEVPLGLTADTVSRLTGVPSGTLSSECFRRRLMWVLHSDTAGCMRAQHRRDTQHLHNQLGGCVL